MINKVVFIGYQPLTEKVMEDFYFQKLTNERISVEYWNLTDIYFPNILKDDLIGHSTVKINSFSKLKDCLKNENIENTLFISTITFEYRVLALYRLLSKYKCKTSFFARGALPSFPQESKVKSVFFKLLKILDLSLFFRFLRNKYALLLKKVKMISSHAIVFRAGKIGTQTIGVGYLIEENEAKIIEVNSFDFDKYIETKECAKILGNKYCVYLDEYLPHHPDFEMLNIKTIESTAFYNKLNDFFDFIEKKYDMEVVIAAHPKAEKYKEKDFFNNRKVFFNKTANLTRYSEFILAHCSTSISFAVLNNKPVLFLISDAIKNIMPYYFNFIIGFSKTLGSKFINIDEDFCENIEISKPNDLKYLEYKYNYLTSQKSEMRVSSEIFIETILNM